MCTNKNQPFSIFSLEWSLVHYAISMAWIQFENVYLYYFCTNFVLSICMLYSMCIKHTNLDIFVDTSLDRIVNDNYLRCSGDMCWFYLLPFLFSIFSNWFPLKFYVHDELTGPCYAEQLHMTSRSLPFMIITSLNVTCSVLLVFSRRFSR